MRFSLWPRTLASQLSLIFLVGLIVAHGLSFGVQFYERYQSAEAMLMTNLENDVSIAVSVLDRLPPAERAEWLPRFERRTYHYLLGEGLPGTPLDLKNAHESVLSIETAIGHRYKVTYSKIADAQQHFQAHLQLADGSPLTIDVRPSVMPLSSWLPMVLLVQLTLLLICTWLAVRTAIRPLTRLARAVETLDPNARTVHLDERGPTEVAHAAAAFNAMQERIASYLKERMQILAAISHDLQTPITRMKLRSEFMDEGVEKEKLWQDLDEIENLVREGVAYARSVHGATEASCRIDLDSFLDSLAYDYQDMGKPVQLLGKNAAVLETRPHALRRVMVNLVDNALKYAGSAEIDVQSHADSSLSIRIMDRGPGIAEEELARVLMPFYRVENSRNRDTGGTGLGLAIAQQLAQAIGGTLTLSNREGGGLCAELKLQRH
jgi:signal transduction histidine kinase